MPALLLGGRFSPDNTTLFVNRDRANGRHSSQERDRQRWIAAITIWLHAKSAYIRSSIYLIGLTTPNQMKIFVRAVIASWSCVIDKPDCLRLDNGG
jgi:hypothetical protein